ncbi:hypothetical protein GTZ78_25900 [Streptomyces sp. SID8361]|nr:MULTISPECIES: hypothetical protein [unclassified Streptomyces]MYU14031.1 hypothetical protein [Streptomyces sp. SID8361]WHX22028.1 hypothetical protein QFW82_35915 [Streptomyces sp. NA07423]SCG03922.1 hypothetical protein GA0115260_106915 [Streptomyces sp. MnatMP-M27]
MSGEAKHHWIVALDIENFSPRRDPVQRRVRAAMYRVLGGAMERAGLAVTDTVSEDRGDGVLMLIRSSVSPVVIAGPFVRELDEGLGEYAQEVNEDHTVRLRMALHQGLATDDEHGWSGNAVNTTCRIVDAQPLRDVLASAPSARMAFAVSDEVHRAVIRHGHRGIDAAAYLPFDLTTKHGETISTWITVPGYPAPPGLPAPAAGPPCDQEAPTETDGQQSTAADRPSDGRPSVVQHAATVQGDQVAGSKHVTVHNTGNVRL